MQFKLNNVFKSYSNNNRENRDVLSNLNLEIEKGDTIAIVGPSGSGKSTLLNLLGLMDKPSSGEVFYEGKSINSYSRQEELHYRNTQIGFVFQLHHLLPQCNILENILIPTLPQKAKSKTIDSDLEELMTKLGIWDLRFQKPAELSVGECQRAAIARAMINKPSIILADEPTGSLDEKNAFHLGELLTELNVNQGITIVVVTHSMKFAKLMNKVYSLENGKLEFIESKN